MTQQHGYIYIRTHPSYDIENACKVGKTKNIPERENTYATGEIRRGNSLQFLKFILKIWMRLNAQSKKNSAN